MKRLSIAVLSVLILFCLASCNQDAIVDGGGTSPSVELKTSIEVPVPEFGTTVDESSKGLGEMPLKYFGGDHNFACAVMTTLPTMTNLRSATISLDMNGRIKDGVSLYFHIYGFDLRLNAENSRFNDDGVYLQYDIMYAGSSVGFVDYYYNYKTKSFTYRQSVLCTFGIPKEIANGIDGITNNLLLNLEYTDIEIKNPLSPAFEAGQLRNDGYLADNAVIDRFNPVDRFCDEYGNLFIDKPWFSRAFVTTKQVKEKGDFITYSFLQADTRSCTRKEGVKSWNEIDYDGIEAVMSKYVDKNEDGSTDYLIDTDEERKNADYRMIFDLLPFMYEKGESIVSHHGKDNGGYESYESFKNDSFKESLKAEFRRAFNVGEEGAGDWGNNDYAVIYNSRTQKGASCRDFSPMDNTKYESSGFDKFYGEYKGENDKIKEFLITNHLKACGIEDDSYISNFITAYSNRTRNGMDRVRADV